MKTKFVLISMLAVILITRAVPASAAVQVVSKSPYAGAIAIDAATGRVLFEDNADARLYPASVTKLMVLLVLLEAIEAGRMNPAEPVTVTAEAAKIGGSQVYLKENEVFSVNDLMYALMVESANDAAVALAIHYAGSKAAFVDLMNARAREIGMKDTIFRSVHGLPPGKGQSPDVSTARDIARLSREILKKPGALKYTSTRCRSFRTHTGHPFMMTNHNKLLGRVEGCDGLKTGYFRAAGYSIAATATKNNKRAIAVVLGASHAKVRNAKAKEMLANGLRDLATSAASAAPAAAHGSPR